ncbi:hypothetical protein [Glycomyces harbinensis]|uniref:Major facilitator superfamily (MFS) profile domain-containing protein n=1 Tax=Glycomyces harbinensis TaxID=58114 RepID=A0A1G6SZQ6_9ACTN|nr:hypothetical protein [Glycomyces harbinensis]SDD22460.1 hypothetical protein SAMN05216270_102405 [Glycomyces harbinensis]
MTSYKTDRARAAARAADSAVYGRRRFGSGFFLGLVILVVLAVALGFVLVGDIGETVKVRLGATALSLLVAAPLTCVLGFFIGMFGKVRRLGMGVVVGALIGTLVIVVLFLLLR